MFLQVGNLDEKIYIDLCNKNWEVVEIDCKGWQVISNPPIRFRRNERCEMIDRDDEDKDNLPTEEEMITLARLTIFGNDRKVVREKKRDEEQDEQSRQH